jgi:hypothetical protein
VKAFYLLAIVKWDSLKFHNHKMSLGQSWSRIAWAHSQVKLSVPKCVFCLILLESRRSSLALGESSNLVLNGLHLSSWEKNLGEVWIYLCLGKLSSWFLYLQILGYLPLQMSLFGFDKFLFVMWGGGWNFHHY